MKAIRRDDLLMLIDYFLKDEEWISEHEIKILIDNYGNDMRINSAIRDGISVYTMRRSPLLDALEYSMKEEKSE